MPDKQNDNKFMAMLERRGIVRKSDSEDDQYEADSTDTPANPEAEMRAMFGSPANDASRATPAARQPVPGMSTPILPGDRAAGDDRDHLMREKPHVAESRVVEIPKAEPQGSVDTMSTDNQWHPDTQRMDAPRTVAPVEQEWQRPAEAPRAEQLQTAQTTSPAPYTGSFYSITDNIARGESVADLGVYNEPEQQPQTRVEDYTVRYMEIDDLYRVLSLKAKKTDTIYLIEEYLQSLPETLPDESRREIVSKIVAASGFDYDLLMGDGVLRVKMLKEYAERFSQYTDDYVAARQAELEELDLQIIRIREMIEDRRDLHKKQFFAIEAEAQRLKDILTFISG